VAKLIRRSRAPGKASAAFLRRFRLCRCNSRQSSFPARYSPAPFSPIGTSPSPPRSVYSRNSDSAWRRSERASTCRRAERARRMSAKCAREQRHRGEERGKKKGRRNNVLTAYCQRACRTCRVCPSLSNGPPKRLALWSARQSRDKGPHESARVTLSLSLFLCRYDDRTIVSMRPFLRGYGTLMALFLPASPLVLEHSLDR